MNRLREGVLSLAILSTLLWSFDKGMGITSLLSIIMILVLILAGGIQIKSFAGLVKDIKQGWKLSRKQHQQSIRMSRRKKEWFKKHGYK